jgi:hypothetical protein
MVAVARAAGHASHGARIILDQRRLLWARWLIRDSRRPEFNKSALSAKLFGHDSGSVRAGDLRMVASVLIAAGRIGGACAMAANRQIHSMPRGEHVDNRAD